ncbi:hypothetical protein R1sor_003132 [Riccia sorocarpa]|uniref:Uncharacterized protein n=1 Tax=Riccia sorocarpa TaxID=122646 RepID=A0ABD3H0P6_9MARC
MTASNRSLDGSAAASMARIEKIISNQDILITLCAEFESELLGMKSVSMEESRQTMKWLQSRLNELRGYVYGTVEMATELKTLMNGRRNPLPRRSVLFGTWRIPDLSTTMSRYQETVTNAGYGRKQAMQT